MRSLESVEAERAAREEQREQEEELTREFTAATAKGLADFLMPFLMILFIISLAGSFAIRTGDFFYHPLIQNAFGSDEYKVEQLVRSGFGAKSIKHTSHRFIPYIVEDSDRRRAVADVQKLGDKKYGARVLPETDDRGYLDQMFRLASEWKKSEWRSSNIDSIFLESFLFNATLLKKDTDIPDKESLFRTLFTNRRITVGKSIHNALSSDDERWKRNASALLRDMKEAAGGKMPQGWERKYSSPPEMKILPQDATFGDAFLWFLAGSFILFMFGFLRSSVREDAKKSNILGVSKIRSDPEEAVRLILRAANNGNADGMYNLGLFFFSGIGVEKNREKAFQWIEKAAKKRHPKALFIVGKRKFEEKETPNAGLKDIRRAASLGSGSALNFLGEIAEAENRKRDAMKMYEKAVGKDSPEAMYNAGRMLVQGDGVDRNVEKGMELLERASENDVEEASKLLRRIGKYGESVF